MAATLFHHIKPADVRWLEEHFAKLTPEGWVVPDWIKLMRATMIQEVKPVITSRV
jgi:hypothetical protein